MQYEINFLILQSNTEDLDKIRTEVKNLIEKMAGKITDQLFYQKRKLAYEIRKERYGFYSVFRFEVDGKPEALKELKSELNLSHSIARYLIVKADDLPALEKREIQEDTSTEQPTKAQVNSKTPPAKSDKLEKNIASKSTVSTEASPKQEEEKIVEEEKEPSIEEEVVATLGDKEEKKSEEVEEKSTSPKVKKEEKPSSSPEKTTESEKEEIKRRPTKKQASLEDLDKKLDEILDI